MRVECNSVADFLVNLDGQARRVFGGKVWVEKKVNVEGSDPRMVIKQRVIVQVGAVLREDDGSEYLLIAGEDCGVDYMDGGGEDKGSKIAEALLLNVKTFCDANGLTVRPGKVSE